MPDLHGAIRILADHIFRDQSAESQAKRAAIELALGDGSEAEPASTPQEESPAGESAAPENPTASQSQATQENALAEASPADAPVNPQVLPEA